MKKVYIIGYCGNMARRYRSCLDYLEVEHCGEDLGWIDGSIEECDGIIIATPTEHHLCDIEKLTRYNKPILCEKPFSKTVNLRKFELKGNIQMVNQYAFCGPFPGGITYYNNWNTGKDGLAWDCINIIGLAEGKVEVDNTSPIWKCTINGKDLTLNDIDNSYVKMLQAWTSHPINNIDYIYKAHDKVRDYIEEHNYRYPSKVD